MLHGTIRNDHFHATQRYNNLGADLGFFLGGGALISCSTSTPINHIVFFLQNTSCIRKPQVISSQGVRTPCTLPLDPPLNIVLLRTLKDGLDDAANRNEATDAQI